MDSPTEENLEVPIKRRLDLWIGILLGVGIAAGFSTVKILVAQGFSLSVLGEIEGRLFFATTALVLVVTHVYRDTFITWNNLFIYLTLVISSTVFSLSMWTNTVGFWSAPVIGRFVIIFAFMFLLFSLLVLAEAIFTSELREQRLIPLPTIGLQMVSIFLLLYVGRIIFPPHHIFLIVYLTLSLFDMTSRVPVQHGDEKWEPLLS